MQSSSVYLYPNILDVYRLDASWTNERYRKVYNRNLKIFRSVDNRIDLQVRNPDQKTRNVVGTTLVFNLLSKERDLIIQKDCSIDDASIGRLYVTLDRTEVLDLEEGFYDYNIVQETRDVNGVVLTKTPLYVDTWFGAIGTIEVAGDLQGTLDDTVVVDTFARVVDFDKNLATDGSTPPLNLPRPNYARNTSSDRFAEFYTSEVIDAKPHMGTSSSLHTFQFYFTNYLGDVKIQGSINPQGASPQAGDWQDLATIDPSTENYKNITGKWNWFRIKHTPDELNTGSVDKILYR